MKINRTISGIQMTPEEFSSWWKRHEPELQELLGAKSLSAQLQDQNLIINADLSGYWPFKKSKTEKLLSKWLSDSLGVTEDY